MSVLFVDVLVVFALEREELLLGLENLFILDLFAFDFGAFYYLLAFAFECAFLENYVDRQSNDCSNDESDYNAYKVHI